MGREANFASRVTQSKTDIRQGEIFTGHSNHMDRRETKHLKGRPTRFLRGSLADLATLRKRARRKFVTYRIGIVQPGLAKQGVPAEHLAILGATNSFVQTITDNPLEVFVSE